MPVILTSQKRYLQTWAILDYEIRSALLTSENWQVNGMNYSATIPLCLPSGGTKKYHPNIPRHNNLVRNYKGGEWGTGDDLIIFQNKKNGHLIISGQ